MATLLALICLYAMVKLPSNINILVDEVMTEELPEFQTGVNGFAYNGDIEIAYEVFNNQANNGETILFINGHSHSHLDFPAYFIEGFVEQKYRVIKFDNRGIGESDWILDWDQNTPYLLDDMAQDSIAVLDHFKLNQAHVVGISMGGMIAQIMAIKHASYVQSLTSIMSTGYWSDIELKVMPRSFGFKYLAVNLLYGRNVTTDEQRIKLFLAHRQYLKGKGPYAFDYKTTLQKALYELKRRKGFNPKVSLQHSHAIVKSESRYDGLKKINIPTLVIHGTDDPLITVAHGQKYADMIAGADWMIIQGMGHDLPELYIQEINKSILNLIQNKTNKI